MSEIIVEVTQNGGMVGPIDRDVAHQKNIPHANVMILIKTQGASPQAFFQVRGKNVKKYPGYITLSATGHIKYEDGKTLRELAISNARSEFEEETTGFISKSEVSQIDLTLAARGFFAADGEQQFMFIFVAEMKQLPTVQISQNEEVAQLKILTMDKVLELAKQGKVTPFALEALRLLKLID